MIGHMPRNEGVSMVDARDAPVFSLRVFASGLRRRESTEGKIT